MWVDTASLKILGVMDRNLEIEEDYCKKYGNGTGVYDPKESPFTGWDNFYYLCIFSLIAGTTWYAIFFNRVKQLQKTPVEEFRLEKKSEIFLNENDNK
ncbi:Oidioi.mRNA.OKI2018_I69.PAR.g9714.t1.cds [Oikopleura dioica]|uniref:Oidioi.mRNA.OKI2018_I69.PAR.g9714.t1.cds n=1 Tax=Oikopleura dioica TaxID=34765 RepID=A0ABN7RSD5_OIKDI|nr:Oidioi.mRNA.OKI2018_I69.PAR.g9714.t1.cds [Oikopleura dioica]